MMMKTHMFAGMLTASALMVGLTMGQSPDAVKRAPVPKGAPLVQQRVEQAPAKEPSVSDPAQTEEGRRLHAKRSKEAVELRKSQFDRELDQLQEAIKRIPTSPPDVRGRETLDSLQHLSKVLGIYKESAQEIVEQWPDLELRSQKYQESLHSAPDAMKATVRDLKKRAEAAKTPAEKDRWETAAQIFEGASGHLSSEETRVANVSDVLEKMISELKGHVEFCDIIGQRLTEVPSNLTGSDLDALGKEIETLSGQFEKIMDSMRQLGIELENASTPSAAKRTLPEAA